jgi:hypothetical protein
MSSTRDIKTVGKMETILLPLSGRAICKSRPPISLSRAPFCSRPLKYSLRTPAKEHVAYFTAKLSLAQVHRGQRQIVR